MPVLITALLAFVSSLSGVVIGLGILLAFVVAAIADPAGWLNQSICFVISMVVSVFPSTPSQFRFEGIIVSLSSFIPSVGVYAIREAYLAFRDVLGLIIVFKIYKLIPFKAT